MDTQSLYDDEASLAISFAHLAFMESIIDQLKKETYIHVEQTLCYFEVFFFSDSEKKILSSLLTSMEEYTER